VVMAGKKAIEHGVDAREIAKKTASILGGGGSGRPDFAQGGGTLIKNVPDALRKVEELVKQQVQGKNDKLRLGEN
jgi:alanyl-tRNA synthetase